MIDYFALTFGHALLVLALWRLFISPDLVADPAREEIKQAKYADRAAISAAGRAAARRDAHSNRAHSNKAPSEGGTTRGDAPADGNDGDEEAAR